MLLRLLASRCLFNFRRVIIHQKVPIIQIITFNIMYFPQKFRFPAQYILQVIVSV